MSSITVIKPTFKTDLPNPVTLSESDEQAQLAHQEALWQDRCDYYQSAQ
jgi:hypothetical protein